MSIEKGSHGDIGGMNEKITRRDFVGQLLFLIGSVYLGFLIGDKKNQKKDILSGAEAKPIHNKTETGKKIETESEWEKMAQSMINVEEAIILRSEEPEKIMNICKTIGQYSKDINSFAQEHGIDKRFLYGLIFVESRGNKNAYNEISGAAGLCQFVRGTAKEFELKVSKAEEDYQNDERYNPERSIEAAVEFILKYKVPLGSQDLAIASFHMGYGNMYDLIEIYLDPKKMSDPPAESVKKEKLTYAEIFFNNSHDFNPGTNALLFPNSKEEKDQLKDDSALYYWKIRAASKILGEFNNKENKNNLFAKCVSYYGLENDKFKDKIKKIWDKNDPNQLKKLKWEERMRIKNEEYDQQNT